jgi:class 3 adenylate cyclase/CHASE2 domain-containing sensor protein
LSCSGFFVYVLAVKLKLFKRAPLIIASFVIALVCAIRLLHVDFFDRLERMTYDMRARQALRFPAPAATNLGFVFIDEQSIDFVRTNEFLGFYYGLLWPRRIYGHLVTELYEQGTKAVAFDIIFPDVRRDHPVVPMADGRLLGSEDFFGLQMRRASNVILAATDELRLPKVFETNAMAVADISAKKDSDGILRRAKAFQTRRKWHPAFRQVEADSVYGVDLSKAEIEPGRIVLPRSNAEEIEVPLDADGNFDLADFGGEGRAKPFVEERVWQMGIVLAAQELRLDLSAAAVDLAQRRITLHGAGGVERSIPVDNEGYFYIDWCLSPEDPRLTKEAIESLLQQDRMRLEGKTESLTNRWRGKLVVVGSGAQANNLTDIGATPISSSTLLVSKHWNVANSVLTGRFIRRASIGAELLLIVLMGGVAALLTLRLRAVSAFALVLLSCVAYVLAAIWLYVQWRYWLPLVLPVGSSLVMHLSLLTWRVVFEQAEQRRVRGIFSKVVSPQIVTELLKQGALSLGGARREVTVFFADVRGFTELTDRSQDDVTAFVHRHQLTGEAAEAYFDEQAREIFSTVSAYLSLVAECVIKHDGTLDKYIGDCVMAFWGAPVADSKHAVGCVRAAVDAQRGVYEMNQRRVAENKQRELENGARTSAGLPPKPLMPILLLGTGINTGSVNVGLMGSDAHGSNYTVFGREVNLASRLESASGRGRIFISETTYKHILRDDPALAATCLELPPQNLKGIRAAVKVYEVQWRPPGSPPLEEEFTMPTSETAFTGFVQRESPR